MKLQLHHVGIEVRELYAVELFYRKALGFQPRYRYVSQNTPGLRTVLLEKDGVQVELLERPRDEGFVTARRAGAAAHLSLEVPDVDGAYARLAALGLEGGALGRPRNTGDGFRELELRDPEGNVIELSARIGPEPRYPLRAVIFDLDGTLVDSEENYYLADRDLLATYGISFTREDKRGYVGSGNLEMMTEVKRRYGLPASPAELVDRKNRLYLAIAEAQTLVYPEMKRFWDRLRAERIPVAVASGSSPVVLERVLDAVGLAPEVEVVVSAEDVARGKPAPDIFLEAARRLGVAAHECAVVEDSRHGVEAAKRAFMRCIAVPYLTDKPLADAFLMADLLFDEGMSAFDADRAFRWVEALRRG
jgi:HAD superfamily hydrolase (TIGR01509 family)